MHRPNCRIILQGWLGGRMDKTTDNKSQDCRFESSRRQVRKFLTINEDEKLRRVIRNNKDRIQSRSRFLKTTVKIYVITFIKTVAKDGAFR